jgi:hypothetical protein
MTFWRASFIVEGAVVAVILALFVVRRWAPAGGYFADSTRAAGVFSVLARGVAVLLAFVIFLALQTFRTAKDTAGQEAVATTQLYRTTALLPDPGGSELRGDLVCYGRAVVEDEWGTMSAGGESSTVQGWLDRMTSTIASITPENEREATAYSKWFDQDAQRREGRRGRLASAEPFVPSLLWIVLVVGASLVIGYMFLFADPKERGPVQAYMVGEVTASSCRVLWWSPSSTRPMENEPGPSIPLRCDARFSSWRRLARRPS